MPYKIDRDGCIGCHTCMSVCPVAAISDDGGKCKIDPAICITCSACASVCPVNVISLDIPMATKPAMETTKTVETNPNKDDKNGTPMAA